MRNQKVESTLRAASLLLPAQLLQIGMVRKKELTCFYIILQYIKTYTPKISLLSVISNYRVFHRHLRSQEKAMSILIVKLDSIESNQKELRKWVIL